MTQEERWNIRYQEVMTFIETNKRNPSKYVDEERNMVNFLKHTRKQMNQVSSSSAKRARLFLTKKTGY